MRKLLKIFFIIFALLSLGISLLYGSRIFRTPYIYEYINNSLVVTIPNKIWFEINSQQDTLTKDNNPTYIFENDLLDYTKSGYNIGYIYPTYTAKTVNNTLAKTDIVTRERDTLEIKRSVKIQNPTLHDYYISRISFSKYGTFLNNTYTQDGCDIQVSSENGELKYDPKTATLSISYNPDEVGEIEDTINISVQCKGL